MKFKNWVLKFKEVKPIKFKQFEIVRVSAWNCHRKTAQCCCDCGRFLQFCPWHVLQCTRLLHFCHYYLCQEDTFLLASLCLSVRNFTQKRDLNFMKVLPEMNLWTRKNWLNLEGHAHLFPDREILRILNAARHFPQFGSKNWQNLHENFIADVSLDKEVSVKFWKWSGLTDIRSIIEFCELC